MENSKTRYNQSMKENIVSVLSSDSNVMFAYLFGSYGNGSADYTSDVDIAVFVKDTNMDKRLALHHLLQKTLRKDVDLVILNEVKNIYLLEAILDQGILLKDHPKRIDFELRKEHEIKDFKAFRKYIDMESTVLAI